MKTISLVVLLVSTCLLRTAQAETGIASVYSAGQGLTAAHKSLPFGTVFWSPIIKTEDR